MDLPTPGRDFVVKILLIQGANMSLLGIREPEIYGKTTASELDRRLLDYAEARGFELEIFYTNSEGACIDRIIKAYQDKIDALVMNPGGFTQTARAIGETVKGVRIPYVEVHLSNHYARDMHSIIAEAAQGIIMGLGIQVYFLGLDAALHLVKNKK
jgi:3-dehydroquinate dehydratase II